MALPRFQMTLLLMATGGAGFLASYGLLQLGMDRMALRYLLAVGIAYFVFFLLLRLWILLQREPEEWPEGAIDLAGEAVEAGIDGLGSLGKASSGGGGSSEAQAYRPPSMRPCPGHRARLASIPRSRR